MPATRLSPRLLLSLSCFGRAAVAATGHPMAGQLRPSATLAPAPGPAEGPGAAPSDPFRAASSAALRPSLPAPQPSPAAPSRESRALAALFGGGGGRPRIAGTIEGELRARLGLRAR